MNKLTKETKRERKRVDGQIKSEREGETEREK